MSTSLKVLIAPLIRGGFFSFSFFLAFNFWNPLKSISGLLKWKFYATEGPQPLPADKALFLKSASGHIFTCLLTLIKGDDDMLKIEEYVSHIT